MAVVYILCVVLGSLLTLAALTLSSHFFKHSCVSCHCNCRHPSQNNVLSVATIAFSCFLAAILVYMSYYTFVAGAPGDEYHPTQYYIAIYTSTTYAIGQQFILVLFIMRLQLVLNKFDIHRVNTPRATAEGAKTSKILFTLFGINLLLFFATVIVYSVFDVSIFRLILLAVYVVIFVSIYCYLVGSFVKLIVKLVSHKLETDLAGFGPGSNNLSDSGSGNGNGNGGDNINEDDETIDAAALESQHNENEIYVTIIDSNGVNRVSVTLLVRCVVSITVGFCSTMFFEMIITLLNGIYTEYEPYRKSQSFGLIEISFMLDAFVNLFCIYFLFSFANKPLFYKLCFLCDNCCNSFLTEKIVKENSQYSKAKIVNRLKSMPVHPQRSTKL